MEQKNKTNTPVLMMTGSMLIFGTIGIFRRYIPLAYAYGYEKNKRRYSMGDDHRAFSFL